MYMTYLSEHFAKLGHSVDVWTSDAIDINAIFDTTKERSKIPNEVINGVNVERFSISPFLLSNKYVNKAFRFFGARVPINLVKVLTSSPTVLKMLVRALFSKNLDYDLVHVTSFPYSILFLIGKIVAKKSGAKFVVVPFSHLGVDSNDPIRKIYLNKERLFAFKAADIIISATDAEMKVLKAYITENGIDISKKEFHTIGLWIHPKDLTEKTAPVANLTDMKGSVLYIGPKTADKGVTGLIEAMDILWKKGKPYTLVLAGSDTKEFETYMKSLPEEVSKNIISLGRVPDPERNYLYSVCDIFSMVSKTDSFGIVYLESWFNKKPVIGCTTDVMYEIIENNVDGALVDFGDAKALSSKIDELLKSDEKRVQMGQRGYDKVMRRYTWNARTKVINDIFFNK